MIIEEALKEMRNGKKIRHPSFEPDVYFSSLLYWIHWR